MKVLFITGSGRKDSVTTKLCEIAAGGMPDAEVTLIRPHEMHIEHCNGCGLCSSTGKCRIHDDMHKIYDAVESNDVIVLATPVYFSGPSSLMKQTIDRFQCVWVKGMSKKFRLVALIVAGGQERPIFTHTISVAKAFTVTIGAAWAGELTVSATDDMTDIPDDLRERTLAFAAGLVSAHSEQD
ncbi:MAG: flavodoxin family protein [Methanomassiliicoccaceae archaeon]|nr:flavodoxin family protein [Methanomassiliicoccaceae archaeon]